MASVNTETECTAFAGEAIIASGHLKTVALAAKEVLERDSSAQLLIFDDRTGRVIDVDFRGGAQQVVARFARPEEAAPAAPRGPGRPRLGVVPREVTLLPKHWEWLSAQAGGASVALRKLVELSMREGRDKESQRRAREACYRFASAMAGNLAGFEEAMRALFAGEADKFARLISAWPKGIRTQAGKYAAGAF